MGGGAGRGKYKGKPTGKRSFSTPEDMASGSTSEVKWRARRKKKGVQGLIQTENPNAARKSSIKVNQADASAPSELSRREREELQKQAAKERYQKLQEQGKTEQAAKDLERLALIRRQREEAAKKREEEKTAKEAKKSDARK
eukprot:jgi/Mesen1/9711/ME000069S09117